MSKFALLFQIKHAESEKVVLKYDFEKEISGLELKNHVREQLVKRPELKDFNLARIVYFDKDFQLNVDLSDTDTFNSREKFTVIVEQVC